jgi:hypothetical protein
MDWVALLLIAIIGVAAIVTLGRAPAMISFQM